MKSVLILARHLGTRRGLASRCLYRCLATLTPPPLPTGATKPPGPFPFAVDAADGTCEQVDAEEEQRVVDDFVNVEAEHKFEKHLEQDHVDFYGPADGPLHATHSPVLSRNRRQDRVTPQHLLAITPQDVERTRREQFIKVAVCLEDLHAFAPNEPSPLDDPTHYAAVDAPDGTTDDTAQAENAEVDHLIEEAANMEDKHFVEELHAKQADAARIFAVDAPDGLPDLAMEKENLPEVEHLIDEAATAEDKTFVEQLHVQQDDAARVFAVDSPDGLADWAEQQEGIAEVDHLIAEAAAMENKEFVEHLHAQQAGAARVYAVDSPDGTSDGAVEDDLHCVKEIIDFAATHEDKEEILRIHKENEKLKETLARPFPKGPFNLP